MPPEAPKLDTRTYDDLVDQVETLAEATTDWRRAQPGEPLDFGGALIRIFSRMMERTIARLNQVPEKNFLAFLDLLGTQILPPKPARVPLTFELAKGRSAPTVIPAGTRVAATLTAEETDDILFETAQALIATPAQIAAVFVLDPAANRYGDLTSLVKSDVNAENSRSLSIFEGVASRDQSLYLEHPLLRLDTRKTIRVVFTSNPPASLGLSCFFWSDVSQQWEPSEAVGRLSNRVWFITFENALSPHTVVNPQDGQKFMGHWAKLSLDQVLTEETPPVERVDIYLDYREQDVNPDHIFFNNSELDSSLPFYPFGPQPKPNDTLYLAHSQAFSYPRNVITLNISITGRNSGAVTPTENLEVLWEALTENGWQELQSQNDEDGTQKLSQSGNITFTLPSNIAIAKEKNKLSGWLRVRILQGGYGFDHISHLLPLTTVSKTMEPRNILRVLSVRGFMPGDEIEVTNNSPSERATVQTVDIANHQISLTKNLRQNYPVGTIVQVRGGVNPPVIQKLTIDYRPTLREKPNHCLSSYDLVYSDRTAAIQSKQSFQPFQVPPDESPAFYIGFDRPLGTQPITLFAAVEPPAAAAANRPKTDAHLKWEYKTLAGWQRLSLVDHTNTFSEPGLLTFLPPVDLAQTIEFGQHHYWIRARWVEGQFQAMPRLRRLLTNTVWATQAVAITDEILGSSNGEPDQVFQTAQTPVLLEPALYVREREMPSPAEALALGPEAIQPIDAGGGDRQGAWVQWQVVPDFYGSSGGDRHYILDYLTGQIYFGNEQAGRIPPQGRNNVRISYRTGGGSQGNRPAGNILQLKSTVPYVNGVTNLEPALGGADAESLEQIKQRGPKQIRHRFRAVTVQDYEDLAYEASSEVARAKAFAAASDPINRSWLAPGATALSDDDPAPAGAGQVVLVVVPDRAVPQPIPSLTLINQVEDYILSRCGGGIKVQVGGPQWRKVTIEVEIVPTSLEAAIGLDTQVVERLNQFLHPLTGGPQGQGWAFGRTPQASDIYALLGGIAGVDHARILDIDVGDITASGSTAPSLVFSGDHQVSLTLLEVTQ